MRLRRSAPEVIEDNVRSSVRLEGYVATKVPSFAGTSGLARLHAEPAPAVELPVAQAVELAVATAPALTLIASPSPEQSHPQVDEVRRTPPAIDVAFVERRLEHREVASLPIAAARRDGAGVTAIGETVNVSTSGLQMVMDHAADGDDLDVLVGPRYSVVLRGKLVEQRSEEQGHVWHLYLLEAGADWCSLVDDLA